MVDELHRSTKMMNCATKIMVEDMIEVLAAMDGSHDTIVLLLQQTFTNPKACHMAFVEARRGSHVVP